MMFGLKLAQLIIAKKVNLWSKKLNVNTNVQMVHVFTGMPNAITLGAVHVLLSIFYPDLIHILSISLSLDLDLNGKRPGVISDGNFSS